jgi:hexosaminidase
MVLPRIAALSEVVWGTSNPAELKNFENRLLQHFNFYDFFGYNYSKAIFELSTNIIANKNKDGIIFYLQSVEPEIKFTTDGSDPNNHSNVYSGPININKSQTVKAAYFKNGIQKSAILEQTFYISKSTGKSIQLKNLPHENYATDGPSALVNGIKGNIEKYGNNWLGFSGADLEATIDLGKPTDINSVALNFLKSEGSWIYFPVQIEIYSSLDNVNFINEKNLSREEIYKDNGIIKLNQLNKVSRFIKVIAKNNGIIPEGKPGAGSKSWLFVDEIEIH